MSSSSFVCNCVTCDGQQDVILKKILPSLKTFLMDEDNQHLQKWLDEYKVGDDCPWYDETSDLGKFYGAMVTFSIKFYEIYKFLGLFVPHLIIRFRFLMKNSNQ